MKKELAGASSASSVEVHTDRNPGISCLKPRATRGKGGGGGEKKPTKPTLFAYESREQEEEEEERHGPPMQIATGFLSPSSTCARFSLPFFLPSQSPSSKPQKNRTMFYSSLDSRPGENSLFPPPFLSLSFHFLGERASEKETARPRARARERARTRKRNR